MLLLILKDKSILDEIRSSLIRDGLGWSVEPEKKLIYLWNKNVRTEEELRKTSNEVSVSLFEGCLHGPLTAVCIYMYIAYNIYLCWYFKV